MTLQVKTGIGFAAILGTVGAATLITTTNAAPPKNMAGTTMATPRNAPLPAIDDNTPLTYDQKIVHTLNRMGFGPRPGDVEKVKVMGLEKYVALQLTPDNISDSAVNAKLDSLTLLKQTPEELASLYYNNLKKTVKLAKARQTKEAEGKPTLPDPADMAAMSDTEKKEKLRDAMAAMTPEERRAAMEYRDMRLKMRNTGLELTAEKVTRAVESERQFQEVMTDFWSNHFNIDIRKNACAVYKITDEREVIRPNVFGKFRDLLEASAKSPAMLAYLDNAQSTAPRPDNPQQEKRRKAFIDRLAAAGNENAQVAQAVAKNKGKGGINENYARELMELHTLGVDGGYAQKDVTEVARCLTGWTIDRTTGRFQFAAGRHDNGQKTVLGQIIPAGGGIADGEKVLDIVARHPSTMRFISTELCRRLVSDDPPKTVVDKCVATWKRTDGDLREIYRTIVTSPEFNSRAAYHQKIKSPFEYAVSSVRALGGTIDLSGATPDRVRLVSLAGNKGKGIAPNLTRTVVGQVGILGQPLYQCQPPTGWPEDSKRWVSSGALVARLNYSLALVGGKLADVILPTPQETATDPAQQVNQLTAQLLHGEVTPSTRATLLKQATTAPGNAEVAQTTDRNMRLTALVLGSPEFQRR